MKTLVELSQELKARAQQLQSEAQAATENYLREQAEHEAVIKAEQEAQAHAAKLAEEKWTKRQAAQKAEADRHKQAEHSARILLELNQNATEERLRLQREEVVRTEQKLEHLRFLEEQNREPKEALADPTETKAHRDKFTGNAAQGTGGLEGAGDMSAHLKQLMRFN